MDLKGEECALYRLKKRIMVIFEEMKRQISLYDDLLLADFHWNFHCKNS